MTQVEEDKPTPSGRTRGDFRRKKQEEPQKEKKMEETQSQSAIPNNDSSINIPLSKAQSANRIVREIMDRKEFWIFLSGLALGYILGRF